MSFPPTCFVIGAQKAGTTTLATLLDGQADICLSTPKEPHFFSKNHGRGLEWYRACFEQPEKSILVDASPDYSRAPTRDFPERKSYDGAAFQHIPQRIFNCNPDAKFIYILRNPVSRTYSSYWHNIRANYEDGEFSELIRSNDRYLVASDYLGQINNFLEFFSLEQFHFIRFEELVKTPDTTLEQCCQFLNIDYTPVEQSADVHKNASYQLNSLGALARRLSGSTKTFKNISRAIRAPLPASLQSYLRNLTTADIPEIALEDELYLMSLFQPGYAELAEITGLNLDSWNKQKKRN